MFFLVSWFILIIYQPFFNLLVFIYMLLDSFTNGHADMGTAVILFTVAFRILWLPISLASGRSYNEQKIIAQKVEEITKNYSHDPIAERAAIKTLFRSNPKTVFFSTINITLQVLIALMLWRIFAKGLEGEDFHLLYSFIPQNNLHFNLTFLDTYDLSRSSWTLNIIQSCAIFAFEAFQAIFSLDKISRRDIYKAQFFLPVISFFIFMMLPAGKKLFIITTLIFSIIQMLFQHLFYFSVTIGNKLESLGQRAAGITPESDSSISQQPIQKVPADSTNL